MGKKIKVGKARKDKFYQLAKESGYRSRAAFKLLQLNRKYHFLETSKVVVDLCAAPGGWLQVASELSPVSSIIIGVDLVPIKPIKNVITLQDDITTEKCRTAIRRELKNWKADCVLHDGAPNVGKSWLHDAFAQSQLTLQALKLATELLKAGGTFVTKVFRSKDYTALLSSLHKLFKSVEATKPQASRTESAEIFVVCRGFLSPEKLDKTLLDPSYVFREAPPSIKDARTAINLMRPEKQKVNREGYADGDYTLFHAIKASDLVNADNYLDMLANSSQIIIDDPRISDHDATTTEVRECCNDIKVLGRAEIKLLIKWRNRIRRELAKQLSATAGETAAANGDGGESGSDELSDGEKARRQLTALKQEQLLQLRKRSKQQRKAKRKLQQRLQNSGAQSAAAQDDDELFALAHLRSHQDLLQMSNVDNDDDVPWKRRRNDSSSDESGGSCSSDRQKPKAKKFVSFDRSVNGHDQWSDSDSEVDAPADRGRHSKAPVADDSDSDEAADADKRANSLLVSFPESEADRERLWYDKAIFKDVGDWSSEGDTDNESMEDAVAEKGAHVDGTSGQERGVDDDDNNDNNGDDGGFEEVPAAATAAATRLWPEELALGETIVQSQRARREAEDDAFNRYAFNDEEVSKLPSWFVDDEKRHMRPPVELDKDALRYYRDRQKNIDARPIKKVAEAKARKKRTAIRRLEKVRHKAEAVCEAGELSTIEKAQQMKQIYRKAGVAGKRPNVTYVVAKRGGGKRVRRPAGVKGRFKVVDPRMKKDARRLNATKGARAKPTRAKSGAKTQRPTRPRARKTVA